jgi:hypothetical protein
MRIRIGVIAVFVLLCGATTLSQTLGPAATVQAFYRFSNARSAVFNRKHIESRKRWYSLELYRLFLDELKKEEVFLRQHPDEKPFFGDGLSFRPLDEPCQASGKSYRRSQSISRTESGKNRAYVDVKFAYPQPCAEEPIYYRINLRKLGRRWLIDDLTYANGMTLSREMRENGY